MKLKIISSKNFDDYFKNIFEDKKKNDVISGRYDFESIEVNNKINFLFKKFIDVPNFESLTFKILYWEKDNIIEEFFNSNDINDYLITNNYLGEEKPGEVFIDNKKFNNIFFDNLLVNHFNYEKALEPSINIRVQICINYEDCLSLLDIYDDRGLNVYYIGYGNDIN